MFNVNLTNCDIEPIHIPGKIQDYGFLIAIDKTFTIIYCSENISAFLPVAAPTLLGKPASILESYFQHPNNFGFILPVLTLVSHRKGLGQGIPFNLEINGIAFNLLITKSSDAFILEFEPEHAELNNDVQNQVGATLSQMLAEPNLQNLLHNSADQIKKLIGYQRVMVYRFHEDGHGEVVAEAKDEILEPLFGLHYPASDIPKQARELYKINLTRQIADVNSEPAPIATLIEFDSIPLDLTHAAIRAVSPIHIQYLKNMGVASSFSISLLDHGQLWGLVACHNYTPIFINYKARDSAKLIGQVLSSAISFRQMEEDQEKNNNLKTAVSALGKQLLLSDHISDALFNHEVTLLALTAVKIY